MGELGVVLRLMPDAVGADLRSLGAAVSASLPEGVVLRGLQVTDIAFGLQALLVAVRLPDDGALLSRTEERLARLPHVESVEILEESLL